MNIATLQDFDLSSAFITIEKNNIANGADIQNIHKLKGILPSGHNGANFIKLGIFMYF